SNSGDEKTIGKKYPQCKGMPSGMGLTQNWFESPNSMTKLTNLDFPNFDPELIFELEDAAILTDVVSPSNISAKGFLINEKVKKLFEGFKLIEHKYYPAVLIVRRNRLQYYWLHFKANEDYFLRKIDYKQSKFHISNLAYKRIDDLKIFSYQEYLERRKSLSMKYITV